MSIGFSPFLATRLTTGPCYGGRMASIHRTTASARKPWEVRWREGRRQRVQRFSERTDALVFLGDLTRREQLGVHAPSQPALMSLGDWMAVWLTGHGASLGLRTARNYAHQADRWIAPYLADVALRDLGRVRILEWRDTILRSGATPGVANNALRALSACLGQAVDQGLLPANPCARIRKVRQKTPERTGMPVELVEALRLEMPTAIDRAIVSMCAYGGLRPQELVSLEHSDLGERSAYILRADGIDGEKDPKSGKARTIRLLSPVLDDLEPLRGGRGLVFPSRTGRQLDWHNWSARVWRPACARLGVSVVPYEMRHTCASLLIASGWRVLEVANHMGHSPDVCLEVYSHQFERAQMESGEDLEAAVGRLRRAAPALRALRYRFGALPAGGGGGPWSGSRVAADSRRARSS